MNKILKLCAHCNGEAVVVHQEPLTAAPYAITCKLCRSSTKYCTTREEAIIAWNRRPLPNRDALGDFLVKLNSVVDINHETDKLIAILEGK